jgi:hypothetical protein
MRAISRSWAAMMPPGQPAQFGVVAVAQLGLRHRHRALMVRNHHGDEVLVGVAGDRGCRHIVLHPRHALHHRRVGGILWCGHARHVPGSRTDRPSVERSQQECRAAVDHVRLAV